MDKYLIINADDFGMCRAANLAVMDLLKSGSITSSTIMAPCPWAYEACQFAKKNPQFAIGVHLTFTSEWLHTAGRPSARATPTVCAMSSASCIPKASTLRRTPT